MLNDLYRLNVSFMCSHVKKQRNQCVVSCILLLLITIGIVITRIAIVFVYLLNIVTFIITYNVTTIIVYIIPFVITCLTFIILS